jgi:hypothetical protein
MQLILGVAASCNFGTLEYECGQEMNDLWYKTMALKQLVPTIETEPRIELEPPEQELFGEYCRYEYEYNFVFIIFIVC